MMKRFAGILAVAGFMAFATPVAAQLYVQGGVTIPTSDLGDGAKTGWMGLAGYMFSLGDGDIFVGPEVFYGSNSADDDAVGLDKANLLGGNATVGITFGGDDASVTPYVMGTLGVLSVQVKPETGDSETESGVSFGGAVGLGIGERFFVEGRFTSASVAEDFTAAIFGIFAGVVIG